MTRGIDAPPAKKSRRKKLSPLARFAVWESTERIMRELSGLIEGLDAEGRSDIADRLRDAQADVAQVHARVKPGGDA